MELGADSDPVVCMGALYSLGRLGPGLLRKVRLVNFNRYMVGSKDLIGKDQSRHPVAGRIRTVVRRWRAGCDRVTLSTSLRRVHGQRRS